MAIKCSSELAYGMGLLLTLGYTAQGTIHAENVTSDNLYLHQH
jgi:hypothetical protein